MWTSLEVAKLLVGIATPLTLVAVGWWLKQREQINAELVRKRIAIYDALVPMANDILCFFTGRGRWKELDPAKIIEHKRALDRSMHCYRPFWSESCWALYRRFIEASFVEFGGGADRPARLRLDVPHLRRMMGAGFDEAWSASIATEPPGSAQAVEAAYLAWTACLAAEIGARR
jgi:hypothetical protein